MIEWLRRIAAGDRQEGDPVKEYVDIGESRATWLSAGRERAAETVDAVHDFCRQACPVRLRCRGMGCNLYRIDKAASAYMDEEDAD